MCVCAGIRGSGGRRVAGRRRRVGFGTASSRGEDDDTSVGGGNPAMTHTGERLGPARRGIRSAAQREQWARQGRRRGSDQRAMRYSILCGQFAVSTVVARLHCADRNLRRDFFTHRAQHTTTHGHTFERIRATYRFHRRRWHRICAFVCRSVGGVARAESGLHRWTLLAASPRRSRALGRRCCVRVTLCFSSPLLSSPR